MARYSVRQDDVDFPEWDCLFLAIEEQRLLHPLYTEEQIMDELRRLDRIDRAADAAEHIMESRRYG